MSPARPALRGGGPRRPRAVVLVLHGGGEHGERVNRWLDPAVAWMAPFAWAVRRRDRTLAAYRLRNRVFGWNGTATDPVPDARWALARLRARHPGAPIVVVGHSMGGRVAARIAGDDDVSAVVGLAPWLPAGDPVTTRPGQPVLLLYGDRDRVTSPQATSAMAQRMRACGADVTYEEMSGDGHAMLPRVWRWWRRASTFVVEQAGRP